MKISEDTKDGATGSFTEDRQGNYYANLVYFLGLQWYTMLNHPTSKREGVKN